MKFRSFLAWAIGAVAAFGISGAGASAAATPSTTSAAVSSTAPYVGAPNCKVERPVAWGDGGRYTWIGSCANGRATGLGVLRNTLPDATTELFLGKVTAGALTTGALKSASGYTVGTWRNGDVVNHADDDGKQRNAIDEGFKAAAAAAKATAARMQSQLNSKSATYYQSLARQIEQQMQ